MLKERTSDLVKMLANTIVLAIVWKAPSPNYMFLRRNFPSHDENWAHLQGGAIGLS